MSRELSTAVMDADDAEQLAFDVACNFFSDEQLTIRYSLTLKQLDSVKSQPAFQALVDENMRLLQDDGSEFMIQAKKFAMDALNFLKNTMDDEDAPYTIRHKSAKDIMEIARIRTSNAKDQAPAQAINIYTNLALNSQPGGTYTAEALPANVVRIDQQVIEHDNMDLVS